MDRTVTVSSRYVSQPENVVVGAGEKSKYIIRVTCSDHCMDHKQRFVHDLVPFSARGLPYKAGLHTTVDGSLSRNASAAQISRRDPSSE
jgi:hypothetical protein